ncbi:MAG: DUF1259 domain-containing protein [Polyangiaceae bacterium]|nr:DUF1259 domain-containing protein [Polyangiaceae bacterium]
MKSISIAICCALSIAACSSDTEPSAESATPTTATVASATAAPGQASASASAKTAQRTIDPKAVEAVTKGKPEVAQDVVKVSFPRDDVKVAIDGYGMQPFMGLTSWAAFSPAVKDGVEAMVMGDLVVFEDEVNAVMSAALDAGLEVTALHNHFFYDNPRVYFMHIGGEGTVESLGKGVRAALDAASAIRKGRPEPGTTFGMGPLPDRNTIDAAKVEAATGRKPTEKDGMAKIVVGRTATMRDCGCSAGKAMGVNTWAGFAGSNENAVVDGDFAVTEDELQPVLRSLRKAGINIIAIHHHMTHEEPRILFLHYWGRGPVEALGKAVKETLALTKSDAG